MLEFSNTNNKDPNQCHEYLILNGVTVISFLSNSEYDEMGRLAKQADTFFITVKQGQEQLCTDLVNQFIGSN